VLVKVRRWRREEDGFVRKDMAMTDGRVSIGNAFAPIGATIDQGHLELLLRTGTGEFYAVKSVVDIVVWCVGPIEVEGLHLFY
jgi:hypothetical protein